MNSRRSLLALGACAAIAMPRHRAAGDPRFRASLTATTVPDGGGREGAGCVTISLTWRSRPGAAGYQPEVKTGRTGQWSVLPSGPACARARMDGATAVIDHEAADSTIHRLLLYRVVALGPAGAFDTTAVVPVDLPPRHRTVNIQ